MKKTPTNGNFPSPWLRLSRSMCPLSHSAAIAKEGLCASILATIAAGKLLRISGHPFQQLSFLIVNTDDNLACE